MRTAYTSWRFVVFALCVLNFVVVTMFVSHSWLTSKMLNRDHATKAVAATAQESTSPAKGDRNVAAKQPAEGVNIGDCPQKSELLVGKLVIDLNLFEETYWTESKMNISLLRRSGQTTLLGNYKTVDDTDTVPNRTSMFFEPSTCRPTQTVAIIIPFRDRESHLRILLGHLMPILQRQLIRYSVFVVEQLNNETFNKGRLMNTGFTFAKAFGERHGTPFNCFIFHDVDLLVEDDNLLHRCFSGVHHMSTSIEKFKYRHLCCGMTVGGVLALGEEQFQKVNGFSNLYWGWGAEDDDMNKRIHSQTLTIKRPQGKLGRYFMIKHNRDEKNPKSYARHKKLKTAYQRFAADGLSNLDTRIETIRIYPLFTQIMVDVGTPRNPHLRSRN